MTLIRKIINWLKSLFKKLFGKKKITVTTNNNELTNLKSNNKQVNIKETYNGSLPNYMFISSKEKEKLLYTLSLMINALGENNTKLLEKEHSELIRYIKTLGKVNNIDDKKILSIKDIDVITNDFTPEDKNKVISKYNDIIKRNNDFKIHLNEVNKVIKLIEKKDISIIAEDEIEREISNINSDKNILDKDNTKLNDFSNRIFTIIGNIDKDFASEVLKDYEKVNYITLSTTIIDKNYERLMKLEDDFKNHRYNKFYYEREINRIKKELNRLKDIKTNKEVNDHINLLKKELYTKSKDKYDLLYNNEIFINFNNECDELLNKINAKVIDIKKDKEEKKTITNKKEEEYIKKILLRFQDMELAREILLQANERNIKITNRDDIINYINSIYEEFNNGIEANFNYEKNRKRTELVKLYNDINKVIGVVKKEEYIPILHINFKMDDLIEASLYKKDELDIILHNNKINGCESSIIDEKLDNLSGKKTKILKKDNQEK